ncbi:MAG TPA: hypothetical protein VG944_24810 [Fimbriimonas sp.]|nr:hypothetical protein [Fimbriimonas sp.]
MLNSKGILTFALATFAVASSFAASVVGTWHGHVDLRGLKIPANAPPDQVKSVKAMFSKMKLDLTLKANKTFSVSYAGLGEKPGSDSGTWSQSGNKVSLKVKGHPQVATVSANGKSMVMIAPNGLGFKVIFTR